MKTLVTLFVFFNVSIVGAMEAKAILEKMQAVYAKSKTYEYKSQFSLYKGHKSTEEVSFYEGYTYRNEGGVYQKIDDVEFVYGVDFSLRIENKSKSFELLNATNVNEFPVNLDIALKNCYEIKSEQKEGYYSVTLLIKKNSDVPLSVLKMRIDDQSFHIQQLDLYFSTSQDFSESVNKTDFHSPHLKIKIIDFSTKSKNNKEILKQDHYIKYNGSSYVLKDTYQGYHFTNNQTKK
jgi:hypothetical protein